MLIVSLSTTSTPRGVAQGPNEGRLHYTCGAFNVNTQCQWRELGPVVRGGREGGGGNDDLTSGGKGGLGGGNGTDGAAGGSSEGGVGGKGAGEEGGYGGHGNRPSGGGDEPGDDRTTRRIKVEPGVGAGTSEPGRGGEEGGEVKMCECGEKADFVDAREVRPKRVLFLQSVVPPMDAILTQLMFRYFRRSATGNIECGRNPDLSGVPT